MKTKLHPGPTLEKEVVGQRWFGWLFILLHFVANNKSLLWVGANCEFPVSIFQIESTDHPETKKS